MPMTSYHGAGYVEVRAKMRPLKSPPSRRVPRTGDLGIWSRPADWIKFLAAGTPAPPCLVRQVGRTCNGRDPRSRQLAQSRVDCRYPWASTQFRNARTSATCPVVPTVPVAERWPDASKPRIGVRRPIPCGRRRWVPGHCRCAPVVVPLSGGVRGGRWPASRVTYRLLCWRGPRTERWLGRRWIREVRSGMPRWPEASSVSVIMGPGRQRRDVLAATEDEGIS